MQPVGVLLSLSVDMVLKIWDYTKGAVLWEMRHEGDDITCMVYDYSKRNLVCGTEGCTLVTLDIPHLEGLLRPPTAAGAEDIAGEIVGDGGGAEGGEGEAVDDVEHDQPVEEQPTNF